MSERSKDNQLVEALSWVVVLLVLVGVAVFALPHFFKKPRATTSTGGCINIMRQIDAAANQFALDKGLKTGDPIHFPNDLTPYIKMTSTGIIPSCPAGGIYRISKVGATVSCSLGSTVTPSHIVP